MTNEELTKKAWTREITDERVRVASAYWLDCSPHERTEADGIILARTRGAITSKVRKELLGRSQGACERCKRQGVPLQAAHLIRRWQLDCTTSSVLAHLCLPCHLWADSTKEGREWLTAFEIKLREGA